MSPWFAIQLAVGRPGLWADERIELGSLRRGSPEEGLLRAVESRAARSSKAVVTLTEAVLPVLVERHGPAVRDKAFVIPTCVDLDRFPLSEPLPLEPVRLLLSGTLNARYDVAAMVRLASFLGRRCETSLDVVKPSPTPWDGYLESAGASLRPKKPSEMPHVIPRASVGLCLLKKGPSPASLASMPTKLGEFLAAGRPVVVSAGLGDMPELVRRHSCGVVADDMSDTGLELAAESLYSLVLDDATPKRCRAFAEEHFDVRAGVDRLIEAYRLASGL